MNVVFQTQQEKERGEERKVTKRERERRREIKRARAHGYLLNIKIMLIRFNRISHDNGGIAA